MAEAILIREYGKSSVMKLEPVKTTLPGPNEIVIRQSAIGVNFHDIYVRSGMYKTLGLPGILGCEGTGIVEAIGTEVNDFKQGDQVGYVTGPPYGAYASHRTLPAKAAVTLPGSMSHELVAGTLLRALTVDMLVNQVCQLEAGMTILIHAAAGGVGRLLCQTASQRGVTVIGTVGSKEKSTIASNAGCTHPILYREVSFDKSVEELTKGVGVDVVFDSIGADTFEQSMKSLALCGQLVQFGQSSGPVNPITLASLAEKSLTVSRPILFHYIQNTDRYRRAAHSVFQQFADGQLHADEPKLFSLDKACDAHDYLESRLATQPIVLVP